MKMSKNRPLEITNTKADISFFADLLNHEVTSAKVPDQDRTGLVEVTPKGSSSGQADGADSAPSDADRAVAADSIALLDSVTASNDIWSSVKDAGPRLNGLVIGRLVSFDEAGRPCVRFSVTDGSQDSIVARTTTPLIAQHVGRDVAILCENGDPSRPIIIGLMHCTRSSESAMGARGASYSVDVDLALSAERQITLRCGDASITLTRAGKIILRGKYVLSRASGVNKIKGGSVQIN